ncbi:hypothetical protein BH09PLA1_BH09PLA1_24470 [soil metagenome]
MNLLAVRWGSSIIEFMTETGHLEWDDSNLPSQPLDLHAAAPETQDTLIAAIEDMLHEAPVAALKLISTTAYSNYAVAGVLSNAFAVGNVGAGDDFYLIGAPPEVGSHLPLISGIFFDSSGQLLCRLERNVLASNPAGCEIVRGNHLGYDVRDAQGNLVLNVHTRWQMAPEIGRSFVTTVTGRFYDRAGALIGQARGGAEDARSFGLPAAFGFTGAGLGMNVGFDERQIALVTVTMAAGGKYYEPLSGMIENQTIWLDGKLITDGTEITQCRLILESGDFVVMPGAKFVINNNELDLRGPARNVGFLVAGVDGSPGPHQQ